MQYLAISFDKPIINAFFRWHFLHGNLSWTVSTQPETP